MSSKEGIFSIADSAGFGTAGEAVPSDRRGLLSWVGYAGLWAALSSSALFFGAGTLLERYQAGPSVSVELSDWAWLGSLKLALDKPIQTNPNVAMVAPFVGPVVPVGIQLVVSEVVPLVVAKPTPKAPALRNHEKNPHVLARINSAAAKNHKTAHISNKAIDRLLAQGDVVTVRQAQSVSHPVDNQALVGPHFTEAERMQNLRGMLRVSFFAAVDIHPATITAKLDEVPAMPVTQAPLKKAVTHIVHHQKKPAAVVARAPREVAPPVVTSVSLAASNPSRPAHELIQEQKRLLNGLSAVPAAKEATPQLLQTVTPQQTPLKSAASEPRPALITTDVAAAATSPTPTITISIPQSATSGTVVAQATAEGSSDYSTQFGYSAHPHITVSIPSDTVKTTQAAPLATQVSVQKAPATQVPSFVEAFEWSTPILPSQTEELTHELGGGVGEVIGWELSRAENHWPTLVWKAGYAATRQVPLVSNNALFFLANLAQPSVKVQASASIVFGKVAAGWTVELSGRSERPVFLTTDNKPVSISDMDSERYFAFLNVEPGSHLIYLMNRSGTAGAAAIPALAGVSTYVDVTQTVKRAMTGHVMDAGATKFAGLANVQVRVVGQPNAKAVTDTAGNFRIEDVTFIGNLPTYLETDADLGATHRYRVVAGQERNLTLYRLRDVQVRDLVDQLEGGVSPDSGLIVAALPQFIQASPEGMFPSISSLLPTPTLRPETYTMGNSGQLEVNTSLGADAVRFVSVQVPDGPALAKIENKSQATIWSELVFAQARIVNIVGPY